MILIISCCTILTILAVMIIMKHVIKPRQKYASSGPNSDPKNKGDILHDKPKKSGLTTQAPKKTYLVYAGYYLILKNNSPIKSTNNVKDATPISTSTYKITGSDNLAVVLKTEDGSSFITVNTLPSQATILYTDDVKLNYIAPTGIATLGLIEQPKVYGGGYFVNTLGESQYVGVDDGGGVELIIDTNTYYDIYGILNALNFQLVTV